MANLSISSIRERLFNDTKHEKTVARSSNPFAANSFKGNVLTADVFESANKNISFTGAIPAKSKLIASALVGSISSMGNRWNHGIESVVAFGNRMREGVAGFWNKMNGIEISLDFAGAGSALKTRLSSMFEHQDSAKALAKRPISELREMLLAERTIVEAV